MVGDGDGRKLVGRKTFTIGCPAGRWPAVCYSGTITRAYTDSRGSVFRSSQQIAGGQSGGAMFDAETGYLVGLTNWGTGRTTESLAVKTWRGELTKRIDGK